MKRLAGAMVLACMAGGAGATEAEDANAWLEGSWQNQWEAETWTFGPEGLWTQYIGGEVYETNFEVEARPANTFAVISKTTGKVYIVHRRSDRGFSISEEGETAALGSFTRLND